MRTSSCLLLALCVLLCACETETRAEKEKRAQAKTLDDFYETAWVQCVNDLGMERCRVIQETGFQQCHNYRTAGGTESPSECMRRRMDERLEQLTTGGQTKAPDDKGWDPANPRAAPAVHPEPPPEPPPEAPETMPGAPVHEKF